MNNLTDHQLLADYAAQRSEAAFAELVRRHVDLVHSAALRLVRDAHAAQDVTQAVFLALAQNARQLTARPALEGWLHGTTRNLAANAVRSDLRRRAREQKAALMNELLSADPDTRWEPIAPHLDEALGELDEPDRDVLLLRYFKNHDLRTVGATLGISDDAAPWNACANFSPNAASPSARADSSPSSRPTPSKPRRWDWRSRFQPLPLSPEPPSPPPQPQLPRKPSP